MSRIRILLLISAFLAVVTAACKPGSEQPSAATATSETAGREMLTFINEEGEEEQVPKPAPEFVDAMLARVDAGELTLEVAIISSLRVMAGEASFEEVYGEGQTYFESGWGLTAMAAELYQSTSDEEAKAEIVRLLNIISPPQENLDRYAIPDETTGNRLPGFAAPAESRAAGTVPCESVWAAGFPTDVEEPPVCLLFRSFSDEGYNYRVYYPEERRGDAGFLAYVEASVEAIQESRAVYDPLSNIGSINLIFTILPSPLDSAAEVPGIASADAAATTCPISVFPPALTLDIPSFKQSIAHEMFHCLHYFRVGLSGFRAGSWYQEGMAEYFSNVVYPTVNFEQRYLEDFNIRSASEWLMDMNYENAIFFQYLGLRFGNDYLINLLDVLAATEDTQEAQATAMASFGDMQTVFHEFSRSYLMKEILDTSGEPWPITLYYLEENNFDIGEGHEVLLGTAPFTIQRFILFFVEGREYDVSRSTAGAAGLASWRAPAPGRFEEIPATYRSLCASDPRRLVLLTSATGSISATTQSEMTLGFTSTETGYLDCCLVGTWEQATDEIRRNLEIVLPPEATILDLSGRFLLVITTEGATTFTPQDYSATVEIGESQAAFNITGTSVTEFTTPVEGTIVTSSESTSFVGTVTTADGTSASVPIEGFGMPVGEWNYTCSETTLTAIIPSRLAPFETTTYTRISEIPATPEPDEEFPEAPPSESGAEGDIGPSGGTCMQGAAGDFTASGSNATWSLNNSSSDSLEISEITINWPSENGNLLEISLDGMTIFSGSESSAPARIDSWSGDATARTLAAGRSAELGFRFSGTAGPADYILVVNLTNGCFFSDVR